MKFEADEIKHGAPGIAWEHLLMDILLLAAYYFFIDRVVAWQADHLVLSGVIMMALNTAAAAFGILTFFSLYSSDKALQSYRNLLSNFEGAVVGLSAFMTFIAALWWIIPEQAIEEKQLFDVYNTLTMLVYFIVCTFAMSRGLSSVRVLEFSRTATAGRIGVVLNGFFFFFSYALLITSLQIWDADNLFFELAGLLCLLLFYLPLRTFLLLRPPFHIIEFISVMVSFLYMLMRMYG